MMKEILITSSALILALLVIRRIFRNTLSRRFQYALWALVLVRLLVPVNLLPATDFSVLTAAQPVEHAVEERVILNRIFYFQPQGQVSREELEAQNIDPKNVPTSQDLFVMGESDPDNPFSTNWLVRDPESGSVTRYAHMRVGWGFFLDKVWKTGMALMGAFFLLSNLGFYLKLRKNRRPYAAFFERNTTRKVYLVPEGVIPSPCLFGRSIYITPAVADDEHKFRHVLTHESTHAKHWDPLWSLLRCLCLTIYWFDPLVWIAARCSWTDCELACDEGALKELGEAERVPYGKTLLSLIPVKKVSNPMIAATTMTAGKKQLKDRVSRIAKQPRQLLAAALAVAMLAVIVSACTFTGGMGEPTPAPVPSQEPTEDTLRSLTGEELRWFNEEFFNAPEQDEYGFSPYNLRNQFANPGIRYDRPEDIDLYELLYLEGGPVPANELSIVWAGDGGPDDLPCPAYKLTTEEMDDILREYTGLTLAQTNMAGLENFTYQGGAYYWMHGDTNYCGDLNFTVGTREGSTVKLYHTSDFAGSSWYCVTLEEQPDGGYWFVSNQTCEKPIVPTPLPAWEPKKTVSLTELKPYTAPAVTVEPHAGDFSGDLLDNWNFDGYNVVIYRSTDNRIYAALRQEDGTMDVFLTLLRDDCGLFFYHHLLGHDGFYIRHVGGDGDSVYDYFYITGDGVPVRLLTAPFAGAEQLDLNGDGSDEFLSDEGFFFQREGQVYEVKFSALEDRWPGQVQSLSLDPYGKYYTVRGYTDSYQDWVRYLYFDGENLLLYKDETPTVDHMVAGADKGVPEAVVEAAKEFVERVCIEAEKDRKEAELGQLTGAQDPSAPLPEYDDRRVDYFVGPYTYSYGGATVEGWWFNYELHTTTPEKVVLAGGRYITEDNWVSPGYPGCDALFFEVKDGSYRLLDSRMVQESPESYYVNEQVLLMMENNGVELPDGSTYAELNFQKYLGHLTDLTDELRIQYEDGQGGGGTYLIAPQEGNGPYYLNQMKDNYVVWSRAEGEVTTPEGPTVTFSDPYWYNVLQFWKDSGLVMYKRQNMEPEWYEVRYDGDPAQDVYAYRAYPYYWARCWFDEAEQESWEERLLSFPDDGQDRRGIAQMWAQIYEGIKARLTPGGSMTCTYVKVENVEILKGISETWFPADIVDYPHFAFSYDLIFIPENEDALYTLMAGNTGEYEGNDPDVPEGAFEYSRRGSMYLMDGHWHCGGIGTG